MYRMLQRAYELFQRPEAQAPRTQLGSDTNRDWLPPVLGPSDWSGGLIQTMADSSTAWYFDRR